ncbi:MAG: hypothetical protein V3T08_08700, partial [Gemmatimonadota bacterium]
RVPRSQRAALSTRSAWLTPPPQSVQVAVQVDPTKRGSGSVWQAREVAYLRAGVHAATGSTPAASIKKLWPPFRWSGLFGLRASLWRREANPPGLGEAEDG